MHKVTLRKGFTGPHRQRAGITVSREYPYEGELTEEQIKAIEADPELVIEEFKKSEQPHQMVDVQPTKKELLEQAEAEGLELEGINARSKVNEVKEAIEAARAKKDIETPEEVSTEETVTEGDDTTSTEEDNSENR